MYYLPGNSLRSYINLFYIAAGIIVGGKIACGHISFFRRPHNGEHNLINELIINSN